MLGRRAAQRAKRSRKPFGLDGFHLLTARSGTSSRHLLQAGLGIAGVIRDEFPHSIGRNSVASLQHATIALIRREAIPTFFSEPPVVGLSD